MWTERFALEAQVAGNKGDSMIEISMVNGRLWWTGIFSVCKAVNAELHADRRRMMVQLFIDGDLN